MLARSGARHLITRHVFGAIDLRSVLAGIDLGSLPALETILFTDVLPGDDLAVRRALIPTGLAGRIEDRAQPDAAAIGYTSSGPPARPTLIVHDQASIDRTSHVKGKRVSVRVDLGGRRNIKNKLRYIS